MAENLICGIDIGSTKIATVVAIQTNDEEDLRVIGFNSTKSRGVKRGLIIDIDQVTNAIEESVEKAERMAGHKITHAFASVGGPHISSLNSHGVVAVSNPQGDINETDVERVVEAARAISLSTTRQIIEVLPREYMVDGQSGIKNPAGMSGVRLEVDTHLITASITNLKNIDRCLSDLGIENDGFIFSGLASAEAVLTDTEKELGVVLVDIGGGKTDICLYADGALSYSSSIPVGARHVTNDIAVGLRVSLESAEKIKLLLSKTLKLSQGKDQKKPDSLALNELNLPEDVSDVSPKTLIDNIIGARLEEIYRLIGEEIEKSGFGQNIPSGLVVTGGGAHTIGMIETGRKVIGLPIRLGIPTKVIGLLDEVLEPEYASTVGLILWGRKNIIGYESGIKKFNKIFKDFSIESSIGKVKNLVKQFIP
ncbi:cell division protein FtsA [Candidatus Roizmanbacteria bacterium RIFCSPLOWO2_12_FULL_40_12]|uniref:Cell division protein FtsA n=1 Tax=Candidatus Roizmanbacteria bacterium RIFCSPLOWO2_01_FULL_40_42 TaxID=1802066 RepID=A0A1F7J4X0_9BACT|nr:MAG: cell division protein FtsA [Candidatus Roizmanbacteria bacterium RIFCSPHIGHO2_01_FULL_40_98]OGK27399.1 MAG: cell division protein FtsA [Candidatus Roizmanbacteria bacterium RIFCSPHIGHO2_02_FULL_40_53]OGK30728.1 MAG: cell division protein FtsA [Candidatus Roizmanbacteria bacterium RIFCSPHIGHO2_12_41_18]OGK36178.1 MAG: cell division protein FtsA [Candidatus Roizmanbacteria bacterium RIFCSPHIGHO2_12_FULL_40_130]OGK50633.1 MAG: cell division protein FtsA [Candidatus Roizmanbacteria bacteriu